MAEEEVIEIDFSELKKMKVPELKRKLGQLGLETKGNKAELITRIEKYLHEQEEEDLLEEPEEELVDVEEEEEEEEEGGEGSGEQPPVLEEGVSEQQHADPTPAEATQENAENKKTESPEQASEAPAQPQPEPTAIPSTSSGVRISEDVRKLSPAERVQRRAQRFGESSSEVAKKAARAQRFGGSVANGYQGLGKRPLSAVSDGDLEKMKKRAERFGSAVSPAMTQVEQDERKKHRQERFGIAVKDLSEEERRKQRAQRFSGSSS